MHKGNTLSVRPWSQLMHWYRWQPVQIPFFNAAARLAMRLKFKVEPFLLRQELGASIDSIDETLAQKQIFIGCSTIRSGSTFLADLMQNSLPNAKIEHEPNINDYWNYAAVLQQPEAAFDYIESYRKQDILWRINKANTNIYGEWNPFFIMHMKAAKALIPTAKLIHLVRDGRSVVRSIMAREVLGTKDPMTKIVRPSIDDEYHDEWDSMTRFEKVCWKWQSENKFLRETIDTAPIKFELLIKSYDYFKEQLLNPLEIEISQEQWQTAINQPKHASPKHRMPKWEHWKSSEKQIFKRICGEEMRNLGYF